MAILGCPEAIFGAHGGVILKGARGSFKLEAVLDAKVGPKDTKLAFKEPRFAVLTRTHARKGPVPE